MSYKRLIPCIFILGGKAVKWFDDPTVVSEDVIALAKEYSDNGADELLVFDLSSTDQDHDESIELMKKINRVIRIPMVAGAQNHCHFRFKIRFLENAFPAYFQLFINFIAHTEFLFSIIFQSQSSLFVVSLFQHFANFIFYRIIGKCSINCIFHHLKDFFVPNSIIFLNKFQFFRKAGVTHRSVICVDRYF